MDKDCVVVLSGLDGKDGPVVFLGRLSRGPYQGVVKIENATRFSHDRAFSKACEYENGRVRSVEEMIKRSVV